VQIRHAYSSEEVVAVLLTEAWFLQVNPQFYAFRWITLLLTQEFNFADTIHIWDTLLSDPDGPQVTNERTMVCSANLWFELDD
jgi:hypothetical protein